MHAKDGTRCLKSLVNANGMAPLMQYRHSLTAASNRPLTKECPMVLAIMFTVFMTVVGVEACHA